jgi:hypothetical protein
VWVFCCEVCGLRHIHVRPRVATAQAGVAPQRGALQAAGVGTALGGSHLLQHSHRRNESGVHRPGYAAAKVGAVCCASVVVCLSSQAERRLQEEVERVRAYLDDSTEPKITKVAEQELIAKQVGRSALWWWGW